MTWTTPCALVRATPRTSWRRSTRKRSESGKYRIVVDYGYSAASLVLPVVLGALDVEAVAAHAFAATGGAASTANLRSLIGQAKRLVGAVGADFGVVFDRAGERLYLIDESGHEIPVEQALLLYLRLIGSNGKRGKLAFPVTVTSQVDEIVKGSGLEVIRTPASLSELTKAAAQEGVDLRGRDRGRLRLPRLPARLRRHGEPVQAPGAPRAGRAAAVVPRRGAARLDARPPPAAMPVVAEGHRHARADRASKGRDLDLLDGIKVNDRRGWAQVLPDPDEPLVHIYAEGRDEQASNELESELRQLVEEVLQEEAEISS